MIRGMWPYIANVLQKMADMEDRLNKKIEDLSKTNINPITLTGYNVAASKQLESKMNDTNRMLHNIARQNEPEKSDEEKKEKNERTLIVRKYTDAKIRTSKDIRRAINQEFTGEVIRNARTTVGGSILLEFDDKDTADRIKNNWKPTLFGGNAGVVKIRDNPPAGIVKNVFIDDDKTEDDVIEEINKTYPDSEVDLFHKNDEFTGTIKILFNNPEELERALANRITIFDQRHIMEKYKYKPRVIICKYCCEFGHVIRVCGSKERGNKPVCGKCASDHETKDCETTEENYKCYHCDGNHEVGSRNCIIMKSKMEDLLARRRDV